MATTTEAPPTKAPSRRRLTREQAAEELLPLLTNEPQPEARLRAMLFPNEGRGSTSSNDVVRNGLRVLETRGRARRIPRGPGMGHGGWVRAESEHLSAIVEPEDVIFPYFWAMVSIDQMFIDDSYQRPLTTFWEKITKNFDPVLFQTLSLSDREYKAPRRPFAIIDGQTRWHAAKERGITEVPCIVFKGLTVEQEADMFARLQKERKGMVSWHWFRAKLRARDPEAIAIHDLVTSVGYQMGDATGQLRAVGALQSCYRSDAATLERALIDYHDAFGDEAPEGPHIRGMHYFLRQYPIGRRKREVVDDTRLVRRMKARGLEGIKRGASIQKEASRDKRGAAAKWMALSIEQVYTS